MIKKLSQHPIASVIVGCSVAVTLIGFGTTVAGSTDGDVPNTHQPNVERDKPGTLANADATDETPPSNRLDSEKSEVVAGIPLGDLEPMDGSSKWEYDGVAKVAGTNYPSSVSQDSCEYGDKETYVYGIHGYTNFTATIGMSDTTRPDTASIVQIMIDDKLVWEQEINADGTTHDVDLDIANHAFMRIQLEGASEETCSHLVKSSKEGVVFGSPTLFD